LKLANISNFYYKNELYFSKKEKRLGTKYIEFLFTSIFLKKKKRKNESGKRKVV